MRILLVNPNKVKSPPVPPIGLEYIAAALKDGGHDIRFADLCFSEGSDELGDVICDFCPEISLLTVRNLDSVLYPGNEFYLDGIRSVADYLKEKGLKVIAGGAAVTADPEGVVRYIGADYGISGYAEPVINEILMKIVSDAPPSGLFSSGFHPEFRCRREIGLTDYDAYMRRGGIAGFETHRGCSSSCIYCLEANSPVAFRDPDDAIAELKSFSEMGIDRFHLCDPEFNEDLDQSIDFCSRLKNSGPSVSWSVYMKPANYNQKLFRLMKQSGVDLITLTVDSFKKCPLYWNDIEKMIFSAKNVGIKIFVDFLTGFPYEDEELLKWCIDFFRRLQPDRVNINTHIRLYRKLFISRILSLDPALSGNLVGNIDDESMIRPVFYNQIQHEQLQSIIADDSIFRISSGDNSVNYLQL